MSGRRGPPKATLADVLCQKCLKRGHYSYECKIAPQDRPYRSRPSRSQQLQNPKLVPKLHDDLLESSPARDGVADKYFYKRKIERRRGGDADEHSENEDLAAGTKKRLVRGTTTRADEARQQRQHSGSVPGADVSYSTSYSASEGTLHQQHTPSHRVEHTARHLHKHSRQSPTCSQSPPPSTGSGCSVRLKRSLAEQHMVGGSREHDSNTVSQTSDSALHRYIPTFNGSHSNPDSPATISYGSEQKPTHNRSVNKETRHRHNQSRDTKAHHDRDARDEKYYRQRDDDSNPSSRNDAEEQNKRFRSLSPFSRRLVLTQNTKNRH